MGNSGLVSLFIVKTHKKRNLYLLGLKYEFSIYVFTNKKLIKVRFVINKSIIKNGFIRGL